MSTYQIMQEATQPASRSVQAVGPGAAPRRASGQHWLSLEQPTAVRTT